MQPRYDHFSLVCGFLAGALAAGCASLTFPKLGVLCLGLGGALAAISAVRICGLVSLSSVFFVSSTLYAVSGPLAVLTGVGLPEIFGEDLAVDSYIVHAAVAFCSSILGFFVAVRWRLGDSNEAQACTRLSARKLSYLLLAGALVGVLAAVAQIINYVRVGGFDALLQGKAFFLSELSDLEGDIPVEPLIYASAFFCGLGFSLPSNVMVPQVVRMCLVAGAAGPLLALASYLFIGRRIELVAVTLAFFAGRYWFYSMPKLRPAAVCGALLFYLSLTALYGIRDIIPSSMQSGDFSEVEERLKSPTYWSQIINPGSNEFGAPLGNYSAYVKNSGPLLLGQSYITGLSIPIPRLLWQNKPISLVYQFRDEYFPSEAERGSIASTGFSSLLEAYMNFGVGGIVVFYILLVYALARIDIASRISATWTIRLTQALLFSFALTLHRSAFDAPYFIPAMGVFFTACCFAFLISVFEAPAKR
jgi:hypothetical protein